MTRNVEIRFSHEIESQIIFIWPPSCYPMSSRHTPTVTANKKPVFRGIDQSEAVKHKAHQKPSQDAGKS